MGADMMSEYFIFTTAAVLVVIEYARKDSVAAGKAILTKLKKEEEAQELNTRFQMLQDRIHHLEEKQDKLIQAIIKMEDGLVKKTILQLPQLIQLADQVIQPPMRDRNNTNTTNNNNDKSASGVQHNKYN
jgi:hypothetical protein